MSTRYPCEFLVFERPARLQRSPLPAAAAVGSRVEGARLGDSRHSKRQRSDRLRLDRPPRALAGMRIG